MIKLSIIIPMYNVEKYIENCILSVIENNLSVEDYEIIVVDDQSPDNSLSIVNNLMRDFKQIKLLSQLNKGLGGARNSGIYKAKGAYVLFLDSDDYLKENALKNILYYAIEYDLDILEFGAIGVSEKGNEVYRYSGFIEKSQNGFDYLSSNLLMESACNKLYKVKFLLDNNLCFKERIFIEDFEFNTRAFFYAKKVRSIDIILGCFVQTLNSITRNTSKLKKLKMLNDIEEVIDLSLGFKNSQYNLNLIEQNVFTKRHSFLTITFFYHLYKSNISIEEKKESIERFRCKNMYPIVIKLNPISKNIFKFIVNNKFLFIQLCRLHKLLNKYR